MLKPLVVMGVVAAALTLSAASSPESSLAFTDITRQAGIRFTHNNGAFGKKYLPETIGSGVVFFDADADGWQVIFFVNSMNWHGRPASRSSFAL